MQLPSEIHLISADYLKKVTQINGSVDENYIRPAITIAQDIHLESYLGTDLIQYIKTNRASLSGLYLTLYQKHIVKALAWWTMVELLPSLYVKIDNGNLVLRTSEDTSPITETDLNRFVENSRQRAITYTDKMVKWLCYNRIDEYYSNQNEDQRPIRTISRVNGLVAPRAMDLPWYKTNI
jgi:hypothetical protein